MERKASGGTISMATASTASVGTASEGSASCSRCARDSRRSSGLAPEPRRPRGASQSCTCRRVSDAGGGRATREVTDERARPKLALRPRLIAGRRVLSGGVSVGRVEALAAAGSLGSAEAACTKSGSAGLEGGREGRCRRSLWLRWWCLEAEALEGELWRLRRLCRPRFERWLRLSVSVSRVPASPPSTTRLE